MPLNNQQIVKQHNKDRKRYETYASRRFYRAIRESVLPVIEDTSRQVSHLPFERAYNQVYEFVAVDSAKKEFASVKRLDNQKADLGLQLLLQTWAVWIRDYVARNLGQMIRDVTQNTQDKINDALAESLERGLTRRQTAELIYKKTLGEIGRKRARLIGITESTTASAVGKKKGGTDYGALNGVQMYKKWINVDRPTMRIGHAEQDNKPPIPANDEFIVMNDQGGVNTMDTPGDLSSPASQRCNCACTIVMMSKRFAERNYKI